MEDTPKNNPYFDSDEFLEQLRQQRLQLRRTIMEIMQEVSGETYNFEDNLSQILKTFSKEQQKKVSDKVNLAMLMQRQNPPEQ